MNTPPPVELCISAEPLAGKIPAGDQEAWANLYQNLVPVYLDAAGIANAVSKGHVIAPVLDGWRSYDHFVHGQIIGIDMDTGDSRSAMSTLINHDLVVAYGGVIYSTPSSTSDRPRSRVVFLMDRGVEDPHEYKSLIRTVSRYFDGFDIQSAEPTRTFFGNMNLNDAGVWFDDTRIPVDDILAMRAAQELMQSNAPRSAAPLYADCDMNVEGFLRSCISKAKVGNRNSLGYFMLCRMAEHGVPYDVAEQAALEYAGSIPQHEHLYDEAEALASLRSAYRGAGR